MDCASLDYARGLGRGFSRAEQKRLPAELGRCFCARVSWASFPLAARPHTLCGIWRGPGPGCRVESGGGLELFLFPVFSGGAWRNLCVRRICNPTWRLSSPTCSFSCFPGRASGCLGTTGLSCRSGKLQKVTALEPPAVYPLKPEVEAPLACNNYYWAWCFCFPFESSLKMNSFGSWGSIS